MEKVKGERGGGERKKELLPPFSPIHHVKISADFYLIFGF
jgi:hypothetical protein